MLNLSKCKENHPVYSEKIEIFKIKPVYRFRYILADPCTIETTRLVSDERLINSLQISQILQEIVEFIFDFAVFVTVTVLPINFPFGGSFQSFMAHI